MAKPKGPHGRTGDGGDDGDGGVPRPRGGHHDSSSSIAGGHRAIAEAAAGGRPGGPRSSDGKPTGSQGDNPESGPLRNNPELGKHDDTTLAEIDKARQQVAGRLQEMADEAWDYVDRNKDDILQQDGYQRRRDELLQRYPEDVADLILERTALGTEAHSHLARAIDHEAENMLAPETGFRLRSEVGFDDAGVEQRRVRDQDFRPDVILERQHKDPVTDELNWEVAHAYDLKTGLKTGIDPSWSNRVTRALDLPSPPEELRPTQRPLSVD